MTKPPSPLRLFDVLDGSTNLLVVSGPSMTKLTIHDKEGSSTVYISNTNLLRLKLWLSLMEGANGNQ